MCGCQAGVPDAHIDHGCGRIMSDVSSSFAYYLLEALMWRNATAMARELYPAAAEPYLEVGFKLHYPVWT